MRKGFSLVELLVVMVVFASVSVAFVPVFTMFIRDIPRSYGVVQANTTLLSVLKQMQKDIDTAKQLPESFEGYATNDELLLIELSDGMICYQFKDDTAFRRRLIDARKGIGEDATVWSVPHGKMEWQVWRRSTDRCGYAVEVKTHIEHEIRGRLERKMANSHLYFVGVSRKLLKQR